MGQSQCHNIQGSSVSQRPSTRQADHPAMAEKKVDTLQRGRHSAPDLAEPWLQSHKQKFQEQQCVRSGHRTLFSEAGTLRTLPSASNAQPW